MVDKPEKPYRPNDPAGYEIPDVVAIQALVRGEADQLQQQRALRWIVEHAARTYDLTYFGGPGGDRDSAFAAGKAFVGQQVVKMTKLDVAELKKRKDG